MSVPLPALRRAFPELASLDPSARAAPVAAGLINDTWALGTAWIVQRLHPIFAPEVNLDIAALTPALRAAALPVPTLITTASGAPFVQLVGEDGARRTWRVMTRLEGRTIHRIERPAQAARLGRALARFHGALADSDHRFAFAREGVHDTARHVLSMQAAVRDHATHRLYDRVAALAREVARAFSTMEIGRDLPTRIGHGDPKVSNFLLGPDDRVTGVIDLDTMGLTTLDVEVGDALRSWCSSADEDAIAPDFQPDIYAAAIGGYLSEARGWITDREVRSLAGGCERILLELTARFLTDALEERYFGWDPAIEPTRGAHNLRRAENQWTLWRQVSRRREELEGYL